MTESWLIIVNNSYCNYLMSGLCYYKYTILEQQNGIEPKWCTKEICKRKVE